MVTRLRLSTLVIMLVCSCSPYARYGQDVNHSVFHLDLTEQEKAELSKGVELRKNWFARVDGGGYDSGQLIVKKFPNKNRFEFIHSGKWKNVQKVLIQKDSFETKTEELYDDRGNQIRHTIYLRALSDTKWHMFQYSEVKDDPTLGSIMILDNYHLNGQLNGHLEWSQPHFHETRSHKNKDHIFLPERSYYFNEKGDSITQRQYNETVLSWKQKVGRM